MSFDFDAAVRAPFRMQPGLRRMAPGAAHLTPLIPGSRHQREKLAVLSAFAPQALLAREGFDAGPTLLALCRHAAAEHPRSWAWDGRRAHALHLATAVEGDGDVVQTGTGRFGLGDEVARCLRGLPAPWRLAGLLSLAFAEDFAIVDARDGTVPWLAVALPSHWAPEEKVGRHFAQVHAPVADNALLLKASASLVQLVSGGTPPPRPSGAGADAPKVLLDAQADDAANRTSADPAMAPGAPARWERFVWTVTDHPRLHAHPDRVARPRWQATPVDRAWFRTERQTFIPLPDLGQAVFTIEVAVTPLAEAVADAHRAAALHAAISSMSDEVLAYRGLDGVREPLLSWLAARAGAAVGADGAAGPTDPPGTSGTIGPSAPAGVSGASGGASLSGCEASGRPAPPDTAPLVRP